MNQPAPSQVLFISTEENGFGLDFHQQLKSAIGSIVALPGEKPAGNWIVKVPLGESDSVIGPLLRICRDGLSSAGLTTGPFVDNLSITVKSLNSAAGLQVHAAGMGLNPFLVGDDPSGPASVALPLEEDSSLSAARLPSAVSEADGVLLLSAARPHPFLGLSAAMFNLGCGLLDSSTKLRLHRPVKPVVDTPLCAGCGSCLGACIVDAISFSGGRALIDHKLCTGCGQCMGACHLGGIGPENGMDIALYQKMVADAAAAVSTHFSSETGRPLLFVNFLTSLDRHAGGSLGRDRFLKGNFGALLSKDPVALDQATWDLLVEGAVHGLRQWSGFMQEPAPLMQRAEALKTGTCQYNLITRD